MLVIVMRKFIFLTSPIMLLCTGIMSVPAGYNSEEVRRMLDDDPMDTTPNNSNKPPLVSTGTNPLERERSASTSTCTTVTSSGCSVLPRAYANVKAARGNADTIRPLYGSDVLIKKDLGSFVNEGDSRVKLANYWHCNTKKINMSTSFDLDSMKCTSCVARGSHTVLRRESGGESTVDDSPVVFVLSDQCFPTVLPVEAGGDCIKIMRIEDGGVMELLNAFIEATKGFIIPVGSVLVVFSASHLA
jgi:hypothetical protein